MYQKQALVAAMITILAGSVLAEDTHDHGASGKPALSQESIQGAPVTTDKARMQENMKRTHDQMQKIVAASERAERQRLMDEHMKSMDETTSKMSGKMGGDTAQAGQMDCMGMMQQMTKRHAVEPATPK